MCVELPVEVYKAVRIAVVEDDTSLSKLVRRLLDDYLAARYAARYAAQQPDPLETSDVAGE
jgi:hypothetical protein